MSDDDGQFAKLVQSSAVLFVGLVFQMGFGFLARLVIARFVGKIGYGGVTLGYTMLTAVTAVVVIGLDNGVGRYLPRFDDPGRRRGVLLSAYQIVVPVALLVGGLIAVFADLIATYVFTDPSLTPIVRVFGAAVPLAAFVRLTVGTIRGMQSSLPRVLIREITLPLVRFALIAVAIYLGYEAVGVAWAYGLAYLAAAALAAYYLLRHTPLLTDAQPLQKRRELLAFSAPLMVTATMNLVFHTADTFLIANISPTGTADVAVYNAVYPLVKLLSTTLVAFTFIFMPVISDYHSAEQYDRMERTYQLVTKWILFATLPLALTVVSFPRTVIGYTFGFQYVEGAPALALLAVGFFAHTIVGPSGDSLMALGRSRLMMYITTAVAAINVGLNLAFIPHYPVLGAAAATTIGYVLMNGLYLGFLYRETAFHPFRRSSLLPAGIALAVWVAVALAARSLFADGLAALAATVAAFALCYPVVILRLGGVESEDVELLDAFEDRVGVDLGPLRSVARRLAH